MKRLLLVLILVVVLTLTFATPAFAWDPLGDSNKPGNMPDGPGNMPDQGRAGVSHGQAAYGNGLFWGWGQGQGLPVGPWIAQASLRQILGGWYFTYNGDTQLIPPLAPGIWQTWIFPY